MTDTPNPPTDRIVIRDLLVRCVVGVDEWERTGKQDVLVQMELYVDLSRAGRTDAIDDTVDYRALKKRVVAAAEDSQYHLLEAFTQRLADECLRDRRIRMVRIAADKPGALRFARSVGVEIVRRNGPDGGAPPAAHHSADPHAQDSSGGRLE
jgi:FolB domain-containing protein